MDVPALLSNFLSPLEAGITGARFPALKMLESAAAHRANPETRQLILDLAARVRDFPYPEITGPPPPPPTLGPPLHFSGMQPGQRFLVARSFIDFDNKPIEAGRTLTFRSYHFFPYDGGYTIYFDETVIRLAQINRSNHEVLCDLGLYFTPLTGPPAPPASDTPPQSPPPTPDPSAP